ASNSSFTSHSSSSGQPSSTRARAHASPIPRAAPVIIATPSGLAASAIFNTPSIFQTSYAVLVRGVNRPMAAAVTGSGKLENFVLYDRDADGIVTLTLNQPEARNPISDRDMVE